jgi:hypothetical protein
MFRAFGIVSPVMAGLVPAIHVLPDSRKDVDAHDKRGHDEQERPRSSLGEKPRSFNAGATS